MGKYNTDFFIADLQQFDIFLSDNQLGQFLRYYELLVEWNQMMNLTAITEYENVMKKHFVDSLSLVKACSLSSDLSLIDVGTGAGFPGLALKIAFPDLKVTLLDSLNKRVQFLNKVIEELDLKNIGTLHGRAEDFAKPGELREQYDLCVSRAVANLSTLSELCLPFLKEGGLFVSYKSEKASEELVAAANAISVLGGEVEGQVEFTLPKSDVCRNLILIRKRNETPRKYPRKAGEPMRKPL